MSLAVWLSCERQCCWSEVTNKRERENFRELKLRGFLNFCSVIHCLATRQFGVKAENNQSMHFNQSCKFIQHKNLIMVSPRKLQIVHRPFYFLFNMTFSYSIHGLIIFKTVEAYTV